MRHRTAGSPIPEQQSVGTELAALKAAVDAMLVHVSIIIPVRDEAEHLPACLASGARQDYAPSLLEVIVVDGGSTDGTRAIVESTPSAGRFPVRLLENPGGTTAAGLNIGIREAGGDVIVYVLGHGEIAPDFVTQSVRALQRTGADAVGGPIETCGRGATGRAIAAVVSSPFGVGRALFRYSTREREVPTVAFAAYRREVFDRIGYFDEEQVGDEDSDFHFRLREAGGRIVLVPSIHAIYRPRTSLRALGGQYLAFGAAKASVLRRHPRQLRPHHLAPAALVGTLAAGTLLAPASRRIGRAALLVGVSYATANLAASWRVSRKRGIPPFPHLPAAFVAVHGAYGVGWWLGILGIWRPQAPRRPR